MCRVESTRYMGWGLGLFEGEMMERARRWLGVCAGANANGGDGRIRQWVRQW